MKKLIMHIEYEEKEGYTASRSDLKDVLDRQLDAAAEDFVDFGWRYFDSLEEAAAWEAGEGFPE